jgi:heme-degrading monooxygenase HmoA
MIARIWRGTTSAELSDEYADYLEATGVRELRATPGNLGVLVLRDVDGGEAEFTVASFWWSLEDIKAFAGEDVDRAVYYPEDRRFLHELAPTVEHVEVLVPLIPALRGTGGTRDSSDRHEPAA